MGQLVFRFFLVEAPKDGSGPAMGAQYKYFSWDENPKMIPKAIWALAMLSMNDQERDVVAFNKLQPIVTWWERANPYCAEMVKLVKKRFSQIRRTKDFLKTVQQGRIHKGTPNLRTQELGESTIAVLSDPVTLTREDSVQDQGYSSSSIRRTSKFDSLKKQIQVGRNARVQLTKDEQKQPSTKTKYGKSKTAELRVSKKKISQSSRKVKGCKLEIPGSKLRIDSDDSPGGPS
ncbi:hypothetical protein E8E14_011279 [Neopestalotiopsis sp. 37M]|nr:hypothetical protein E8E14_011279 [Neopestalotiopsis sp. 37M]